MHQAHKILRHYGLSDKEAVVYLACLEQVETSPFALAKTTGVPRTTVYDVLTGLALRGLIEMESSDGLSKQQTKIRAKNPSVLRDSLRQRQDQLVGLELDILTILPDLKGRFAANRNDADFQFYPGAEGAQRILYTTEAAEAPLAAFDNCMSMDAFGMSTMNRDVSVVSERMKARGRGSYRELVGLSDWTQHVLSYQCQRDPSYLQAREIRVVENKLFQPQTRVTIQKQYVYMVSAYQNELWGLSIRSEALAQTLLGIFEVLWLTALPLTLELVRLWGVNPMAEYQQRCGKSTLQ